MPMILSHLGLTVSHIPSATSFYLAALQPLGYHYIGHQGDAIGLGIREAEFFLSQQKEEGRISPTHIAFTAKDRLTVRNCYAAALNAGGRPNGAPRYRNNDCSCFNAAVEDLDGNTIEFIFREQCESDDEEHTLAPSHRSRYQSNGKIDVHSFPSNASQARSRAQGALDLASTTSKSIKQPNPGISRSRTEPVISTSDNGGQMVGNLILGAAGAALLYVAVQSEREGRRDEADFSSSMRSRPRSTKDSHRRSLYDHSTVSKRSNRDYDRAESRTSRNPPRSMRAIEAPSYGSDDVQKANSRYNSSRSRPAMLQRSRTYDVTEYGPRANSAAQSNHLGLQRSSTLPANSPHRYSEATRGTSHSRHGSRRGSLDDSRIKRHDSGVSLRSYHSRRSVEGARRSSFSHGTTTKPSRRYSVYESAVEVPLPSPKGTTRLNTTEQGSRAKSKEPSYFSAAPASLPYAQAGSFVSAAQVPIPPSYSSGAYTDEGEQSDGLSDMKTVVPDDSISCVDFSRPTRKSKSGSKTSRHSSQRSEAEGYRIVRPAKPRSNRPSVMSLPVRSKGDQYSNSQGGKRRSYTYT